MEGKDPGITREHRPFHVMSKVTGPLCNLDCTYCFYLEKERLYPSESRWVMPPDVLEKFIKQRIETERSSHVSFAWQGGEPTLPGVDYFERIVEVQKRYAGDKVIDNALQTNGTLLDDAWGEFLAKHRFLVGISIDGPRSIHDTFRVNKGGRGSFDLVMRGVELLRKHDVEFNTLTVVHRLNSYSPLEVYRFLKEIGSRFMQFIPIVERAAADPSCGGLRLIPPWSDEPGQVTGWSVQPKQYGLFLSAIFDEWVRHDVGSVFVQSFDVALESWLGLPASLCVFRETCGDAIVVEHNGDIFACDHYVYPEQRLGNIADQPLEILAHSEQLHKFGKEKAETLPRVCRQCNVRFACHGECPKHRFSVASDGEPGLNYLCEGYKKFFQHIDGPMRYMAGELRGHRPPANVVRWIAEQERAPHVRNEPCWCGSGRKYKQCHGK